MSSNQDVLCFKIGSFIATYFNIFRDLFQVKGSFFNLSANKDT